MSVFFDFVELFGLLLRAIGFLAIGFGLARFWLEAYPKASWQLQMAWVLGFFGLLIALTDFASPGSSGAFALGAGIAFLLAKVGGKKKPETSGE
jgi:hypothetical protein